MKISVAIDAGRFVYWSVIYIYSHLCQKRKAWGQQQFSLPSVCRYAGYGKGKKIIEVEEGRK